VLLNNVQTIEQRQRGRGREREPDARHSDNEGGNVGDERCDDGGSL